VTVSFVRPLSAANRFQHDWPTGPAKPAVWALGPVSQGSSAAQPVILYHLPTTMARAPPHAPMPKALTTARSMSRQSAGALLSARGS
jgi:hypothetical protein